MLVTRGGHRPGGSIRGIGYAELRIMKQRLALRKETAPSTSAAAEIQTFTYVVHCSYYLLLV